MRLTIAELMRTLDYIPKETAPDLHSKILGRIVAKRYYETVYGKFMKRAERWAAEEKFVESLTEEEKKAWQEYTDDNVFYKEDE